jgi:cytochrome c-type biogenesis protein CcmH
MIVISPETFWLILGAGAMTLLALAIVVWPWMRRTPSAGMDRRTFNIQVYREQLAELETDMAENRIDKEQYQRARDDLERGILEDTRGPSSDSPAAAPVPPPPSPNAGRWAVVLIGVSLPVIALALYFLLNVSIEALSPAAGHPPLAQSAAPATGESGAGAPPAPGGQQFSVENMVKRLAERLKQNPDDPRGWTMLGRSYLIMRRYDDSKQAYAKAYSLKTASGGLTRADASLAADYAEALALANENRITPRVRELAEQALSLDPDNEKGLWLGGMAAFRAEEYALAAQRWRHLSGLLPPGSEMAGALAGALEEADVRAGNIRVPEGDADTEEATPEAGEGAGAEDSPPSVDT